jgi:hypothetical protein
MDEHRGAGTLASGPQDAREAATAAPGVGAVGSRALIGPPQPVLTCYPDARFRVLGLGRK